MTNEFSEEEMKKEVEKPILVALNGLNWFLILALFEKVLNTDNMFATQQDKECCRELFKTIHNQVFNKEDTSLVDLLTIKPKKLITKPDLIV